MNKKTKDRKTNIGLTKIFYPEYIKNFYNSIGKNNLNKNKGQKI